MSVVEEWAGGPYRHGRLWMRDPGAPLRCAPGLPRAGPLALKDEPQVVDLMRAKTRSCGRMRRLLIRCARSGRMPLVQLLAVYESSRSTYSAFSF